MLVVSYTAVARLPVTGRDQPPAVCFLWHFPAGRPGLPLATTLPCGVRTFLGTITSDRDAAARSARPPRRGCYASRPWPGGRCSKRGPARLANVCRRVGRRR